MNWDFEETTKFKVNEKTYDLVDLGVNRKVALVLLKSRWRMRIFLCYLTRFRLNFI